MCTGFKGSCDGQDGRGGTGSLILERFGVCKTLPASEEEAGEDEEHLTYLYPMAPLTVGYPQ